MPFTIGKCNLFRIKHITLLEGERFLRKKHKMELKTKCIIFSKKKNTIRRKHFGFYQVLGGKIYLRTSNNIQGNSMGEDFLAVTLYLQRKLLFFFLFMALNFAFTLNSVLIFFFF